MRVGSSGAEGIFGWLLTSLLRDNAPVLVGSSGAEDFASTRLTCSLVHPLVITPTLKFGIVGSSGATWLFSHQCSKLHRRLRVSLSGDPASDHPVPLVSAELVYFNLSLSSFFVFYFVCPFCFISGIYKCLLNKFISPIDCVVTQSPKS